jgi:hypothetical protein
MNQNNEYQLRVGEKAVVRPGVVRKKISVVNAGMINESVYSLAVMWTYGNNSLAYNLYLQKNQTEIEIPKGKLEILYFSKDVIRFRFIETN